MVAVVADMKVLLEEVEVQAVVELIQEVGYLAKETRAEQWYMLYHTAMLVAAEQVVLAEILVITELTEVQVLAGLD
jgi:hypothetical protein